MIRNWHHLFLISSNVAVQFSKCWVSLESLLKYSFTRCQNLKIVKSRLKRYLLLCNDDQIDQLTELTNPTHFFVILLKQLMLIY